MRSRGSDGAWRLVAVGLCMALGQGLVQAQLPSSPATVPIEQKAEPRAAPRLNPVAIPAAFFEDDEQLDGLAGHELTLTAVELEGNVRIPTVSLAHLWQAQLGRMVTVRELFAIAKRISAEYRRRGYLLSVSVVPPQEIDAANGRVRLRVYEGYIGAVDVLPKQVRGTERVRQILEPATSERPATSELLFGRMLRVNDLPGLAAQANLRRSQQAAAADGASDLLITTEHRPWAAQASLHNRVSEAIGPVRVEASVERRGLVTDFDRHVVRIGSSGNDRLLVLGYNGEVPVGARGLFLNWAISGSRADPLTGAPFNLDTRSVSASVGGSYTALRGFERNLFLRANLTAYNGSTELVQTATKEEQRLRAVRVGVRADTVDPLGGTWVSDVELAVGLKGLGASQAGDPVLGRVGVDPQFRKATLYLSRSQGIGGGWSLQVAASGQYSTDVLPSSEQFGLGGEGFLRAYDPSELLGDHGAAVKLELRRAFAWTSGQASSQKSITAVVYGFAEAGRTYLKGPLGDQASVSARSFGVGVTAEVSRGWSAFVEVARPKGRATNRYRDERERVLAGLSWQH
jgi:hemolysin activation/secretion protein